MKKLIKNYRKGKNVTWDSSRYPLYKELPLRNYYWAPVLDNTELIDYATELPLKPGDAVLIDPKTGKPLSSNSDEAIRDYLTLTNLFEGLANLPEVTITYNKDTEDTTTKVGKSYDDYLKEETSAPIATSEQWEEQADLNFEANSIIRLELEKKAADRKANDLTPGVGSLALLGTVGGLAAWNPLAFATSLAAAKIGEKTVDYAFLQQGYKSFGDWLFEGTNAPEWLKENSNPGTYLGGGFGYNLAKLYLKSIEQSAIKAGIRKGLLQSAAEFLSSKQPYTIYDVEAIELGSRPLIKSRKPGVFYSKTGEVNKGSISGASGNWQIKALMPGNALERKIAPDGTISWKDFEWYLRLKPVEPNDRIHLKVAAEQFSKDNPIPYEELKKVSSNMIPKFTKTNSENLKGYGLDQLGYGHDSGMREHYGYVAKIDPNEGVNAESIVFHNPIGVYDGKHSGDRVHFPDATQHMRGFTLDSEPNTYYVSEIQSDFFLQGMKHHEFYPGTIQEHMAETTLLRGIQEAMLHAASLGKSVVRFPTPETVIKIQYYKPELTQEGLKLAYAERTKYRSALNDFVDLNYPEVVKLRMLEIDAEQNYDTANARVKDYWRQLHPEENNDVRFWILKAKDDIRSANTSELELAKVDPKFRNLLEEKELALKVYEELDKARIDALERAKQDPRYIQILTEGELKVLQIVNDYTQISKGRQNIINKYKAFPKHFRRLFGDKPEIRNVTDSKDNTWFEVDVPLDITTRNLLFSKTGDINKGSLLGSLLNAAKSLKTSLRDSMVKLGTNILDEYYFWQNLGTDKNLLLNIYSGAVDKIPIALRPKVQQGLDDAALDELLRNTIGRRIAAFLKDEAAGLVPKSSTNVIKKGVNKAKQTLETVRVGLFPDLTFDLTELRVAKGFVNGPRTFVGYRDSLPLVEKFLTLVHEGDHIVDRIYPLSPTLKKVINEAFDENFLELPKRLKYYRLWGYRGMLDEATTTTTEARASLLSKYNIFDSTLDAQNKFISSLSDKEIFDTIKNINGYGRYYIDWLRRNKKLTPEKAELFRQAMIVCAKVGEINEGSASATATNLFKSDPEFLDRFKRLLAYTVLSGDGTAGQYGVINLGLPKNVQDYIMHNIIGRRIIAGNKSNWWTGNVQNRAKEVMNDVKVGEFPNWLFKDAGGGFEGQYNPKNNFIAVNAESTKFTPDYIKKHEGDHLIDKTIPLTEEQEDILTKALDEDFLDLPNKSNAGTLKGYQHMDAERTTTIHDAVRRLLSEELLKWDINLQNKLIDKLSDEKIFKALEQANGYGRRYVEFLRENNRLTPEKANQIRSAMKILCATGDVNEGSVVGASRRPILRKNMHEFSDAEWDAAYEAALEKGNKQEMWRLLTLRFLQKAKEYVATKGGDPLILWRGFYREPVHTMKPDGVWLSSDKNYALNFTKDKHDFISPPVLDEQKVYPYFVKGHLETLFPHITYYDLPESLRAPHNYDWPDLYQELIWRVPTNFRLYAENIDNAISFSITHGATSNDIKNAFFKDPVRNRIYDFGKADVIVGHDMPMDPSVYPDWIPSQGIEYNVKNPNYVKLAKLITYDDNGKMIPLSLRFNFRRNDRRYGWLIPLLPFLYPNKKDQAE